MKKIMTGIIIAVMSCTAAARSLTKSEIASVESVIKKNLDNPASARFFHGDFIDVSDGNLYCVQVREKNAYGQYGEKKLFSVLLLQDSKDRYKAWEVDRFNEDTLYPQDIIEEACVGAGYNYKIQESAVYDANKKCQSLGLPPVDKSQIIPRRR
ncbi:TPA: hypothetical protein ACYSBI_003115 [Morganella morganii]|uniref:hypothetical protein n=1 Tax=Morganella morganii TaxID=582 RepID=UPI001BD54B07|nr:hypothetical protein [Morganella morganii]HBL6966130.1 hypothetical protein [Morganella morganii]